MIEYKGSGRVPGPLGISPSQKRGRIPGPLGFFPVVLASPVATKLVKKFSMPAPTDDPKPSTVHEVTVQLSPLGNDEPAMTHVRQGAVGTCPIGAILAALAYTGHKELLHKMVTERQATVETDLIAVAGKIENPPQGKKVVSQRYFIVTLGGAAIEVSDVFYTDDGDRNTWSLVYMGFSRGGPPAALWPSVVEKAYASTLKEGYQELDDEAKHPANEYWAALVGSQPKGGFTVDNHTDLGKIREAAKAARKVPTIGASRDDATKVYPDHGFAIMGIEGSTVELYNPHGHTEKISLADFRTNFKAILYGNP